MPAIEGTGFDSTGVENMGFEPVPEGEYLAMISKSEIKLNKKGTGYYARFYFVILEGHYKGRTFSELVNYLNDSIIAQEIGQRTLATLRRAVLGSDGPLPNTDVLNSIPLKVRLGIIPAGKFPAKNSCLLFKPAQGVASVQPSASQSAPQKTPDWPNPDKPKESSQANNVAKASDESPGWDTKTEDDSIKDDIPF